MRLSRFSAQHQPLQNINRQPFTYLINANTAGVTISTSTFSRYRPGSSDIIVVVKENIWLYSTDTSTAALIVQNFTVGDTITIINNGFIAGKGGSANISAGGPAISINFSVLIQNNGFIAGGGGGGGNGTDSTPTPAYTAGGGGGAGGGQGTYPSIYPPTLKGTDGAYGSGFAYGGGGGWQLPSVVFNSYAGGGTRVAFSAFSTGGIGNGNGGLAGGGGGAVAIWNGSQTTALGGQGGGTGAASLGTSGTGTAPAGLAYAGGGGGGWGSSGGSGIRIVNGVTGPTINGFAGGKAINLNGKTATITGSGATYGAIS